MIKLIGLLVASWVVMITTHETGHLLGGWLSGATLIDFDLAPWRLPYSLHQPDPHPLVTLWAGPLVGTVFPFLVACVMQRQWAWFIADFCLLANGSYLAAAWISADPQLDTPRLLAAGSQPFVIAIFCLFTIAVGYYRFRRDCADCLRPLIAGSPPQDRDEQGARARS